MVLEDGVVLSTPWFQNQAINVSLITGEDGEMGSLYTKFARRIWKILLNLMKSIVNTMRLKC